MPLNGPLATISLANCNLRSNLIHKLDLCGIFERFLSLLWPTTSISAVFVDDDDDDDDNDREVVIEEGPELKYSLSQYRFRLMKASTKLSDIYGDDATDR